MNYEETHYTRIVDPFNEELREERSRWLKAGKSMPVRKDFIEVAELARTYRMYGDELGWALTAKILSSYPGVYVYVLARDCVIIYWAGDTRIHALIRARTVKDLPELLVHNDSNIRKFARKKFDALKALSGKRSR